MLLALDVGNTNVTIGAFLIKGLMTKSSPAAGACAPFANRPRTSGASSSAICFRCLRSDLAAVDGVIISSVVPAVDQPLEAMAERYFDRKPMFVNYLTDLGITVRYDNPREVGADRLVNGVAGYRKYGGPVRGGGSGHHHQLRYRFGRRRVFWAA